MVASLENFTTEFLHINIPYGQVRFTVERASCVTSDYHSLPHIKRQAELGYTDLAGTVIEGTERARLFHSVSVRDLAGEPYSLTVSPEELAQGWKQTVAM